MNEPPANHQKSSLGWLARAIIFATAILIVILVAENLRHFPRTEDAEVRANVIGVAPQVGGTITQIAVVDNQPVQAGDLLFELDARPYEAEAARARARLTLVTLEVQALRDAIAEAEALLRERVAREEYAAAHYARLLRLLEGQFTSPDRVQRALADKESSAALVAEAEASLARARNELGELDGINTRIEEAAAALRDAELKVAFCRVTAPRAGIVTNLQIVPGSYAAVGEQIFTLVDPSVWYVLANFRETDLQKIRVGQPARVFLMSDRRHPREGIVEGIARAVSPNSGVARSAAGGEGILQRVEPTFDFIQLAARFPVRIVLRQADGTADESLRMGGRAAVVVDTRAEPKGVAPR
jgi:multidrug efflux system membrane fusion protein